MKNLLFSALLAALLAPSSASFAEVPFQRPAGAGEVSEAAAGYAAIFTCSAHFFAGRAADDIRRLELVDLARLNLSAPSIDTRRSLVRSVHKGHEAIAAFRPTMGCTLLPPNWSAADVGRLPYVDYPTAPDLSDVPFPAGDDARPRPNAQQRAVLEAAFDGEMYGDGTVTVGVVILKDGELVGERYRDGFGVHSGYRTWSTAKSISSTLIGIAQRDGLLSVSAPANIPEWQYLDDPRQQITLEHLLHMSSGLYSEGANTNAIYFAGQDVISAATTTHLVAEPGTRWKYANNDTLLLLRALRATLGDDLRYLRYPYDELFHRIGMYHTRMETDHLGNFIGSSQVYTTARDLARFALLYLQRGTWGTEQIFPAAWADYVVQAAPALPRETGEQGYGAQFWLLDTLPGVPPGTYTTAGNKGQFATVVPAHNMVIVRTGIDPNGKRWQHDQFIIDAVAAYGS